MALGFLKRNAYSFRQFLVRTAESTALYVIIILKILFDKVKHTIFY